MRRCQRPPQGDLLTEVAVIAPSPTPRLGMVSEFGLFAVDINQLNIQPKFNVSLPIIGF